MSDELILQVFSDKVALKTASEVAKELSERAIKESRKQIDRMDRQVEASGHRKVAACST